MTRKVFSLFIVSILLAAIATGGSYAAQESTTVILVSDNPSDYAVALSLSNTLNAAIVVTEWGTVESEKIQELIAMDPQRVIIIGGPKAVPEEYENALKNAGINVVRIWGQTRIETSLNALEWLKENGYLDNSSVIFVNAWNPEDIMKIIAENPGFIVIPVDKKKFSQFEKVISGAHVSGVYHSEGIQVHVGKEFKVDASQAFMNLYTKLSSAQLDETGSEYLQMALNYYKSGDVKLAFKYLMLAQKHYLITRHEKVEKFENVERYRVNSMDITRRVYLNSAPLPAWEWKGTFATSPYIFTVVMATITRTIPLHHQPEFIIITPKDQSVRVGELFGVNGHFTFSGGISMSNDTIFISRYVVQGNLTVRWNGTIVVSEAPSTTTYHTVRQAIEDGQKLNFTKLAMTYSIVAPGNATIGGGKILYSLENNVMAVSKDIWGTKTISTNFKMKGVPYFFVARVIGSNDSTYTVVGHPIGINQNFTWTITEKGNGFYGVATQTYSIGPAIAYYTFSASS